MQMKSLMFNTAFPLLWSFKSIKHNCCVKIVLRAISFAHIIQRFKEILTRYHVPKLSNLFFQMVIKIYFTSQVNMFSSSSLAPTPYPFCDFIFVPRKIREVRESTVTFDVTDRLNFFLMSLTSWISYWCNYKKVFCLQPLSVYRGLGPCSPTCESIFAILFKLLLF